MNNYTVFHLHTDFSNCNGFSDSCTSFKDYIKLAKKQGMKAIAFSEHGNIYNWVVKKQECDKAGIKYIHGTETYLCHKFEGDDRGCHIGLYARNYSGVKELNQLMSNSTSKGKQDDKTDRHFYFHPRISLMELMSTSDNIIVTTGCLASPLSRWNNEEKQSQMRRLVDWLTQNKHRCFLEIQYHNCQSQKEYNQQLYELSLNTGIPLIAGTDTHSLNDYKAECRKILQKSKNSFYGEEDEFDLTWKSYDELVAEFETQDILPRSVIMEAIENTNRFADMVEDFEFERSFKYPNLYGDKTGDIFKKTIYSKYEQKVKEGVIDGFNPKYKSNIMEEYKAFKSQGMESFMLFMSELMDYCNENDIPYGFCRGSVGGSTIAYILDIIDVDPVLWNTVFSRFCNADRVSLADIDVDFKPDDRAKVYDFIISKFGQKHTSRIATFGTLKDRGCIDVLAKGLDYKDLSLVASIKAQHEEMFKKYKEIIQAEVNLEELDPELANVDFDNHDAYVKIIRDESEIKKANSLKLQFDKLKECNRDLFYYFDGLKGTIISKGHHPAGMIGSPVTIQDNLGVFFNDGDEGFPVSSCAMKAVDFLNFVKFDILGLKAIGIIKSTYDYIGSHYLKSYEIDWFDSKVWEDMITSKTGVFQFQGDYAFDLLKQFRPQRVNDMSLVNASLRPSGKSYRDRLIAREFNNNPSTEIDNLLAENNGYLVYQEDTIKFLTDICGLSGSGADTVRRAISKKEDELLKEQLPKILDGYCSVSKKERGVAEEEAMAFIQIIKDSSEYQFGLNHSTGYSMIGYVCAMLRKYYPLEFVTAILNNADDMDDIKNGTQLANERGIKIKSIEFGKSQSEYTFDKAENTIYKGISSIKFCNAQISDELLQLSQNKYNTFIELLQNIKTKTSVDSRQLTILTGLNFFKKFGKNKYLLDIIELFNKFHNAQKQEIKQIKIKDLEKYGLTEYMIEKYSGKKTAALYKELDIDGILTELSAKIENKGLDLISQVKLELEFLEYCSYVNQSVNEEYYIVVDYYHYKNPATPYLTARNIKTGAETKTRVKQGKIFKQNPFGCFNVLRIAEFSQQFKKKNIGGEWVVTDELEPILEHWEVIR